MPKQLHISSPTTLEAIHPAIQELEGVLKFALEIKDKKISTITRNKAKKAMEYIDAAVTKTNKIYENVEKVLQDLEDRFRKLDKQGEELVKQYNISSVVGQNRLSQQIDRLENDMRNIQSQLDILQPKMDEVNAIIREAQQLIKTNMGENTALGAWFNQNRNTRIKYQQILKGLALSEPTIEKEDLLSRMMTRQMAKDRTKSMMATNKITSDFKQKFSQFINGWNKATPNTEIDLDTTANMRNKNKPSI